MKKIGLVTLFRDNYGSELQCFATKSFLEHHGYECDVLFEKNLGAEKLKFKIKNVSKIGYYSLRYRGFWNNRKFINHSNKLSMNSRISEAQFGLDWFCESILQPKGVDSTLIHSKSFLDEYDYFIAGSDQIWNGSYLVSPFMFLDFAEDSKKVALCPSMSVEKLKNFNVKTFKNSISKFRFLSAREKTGVKIINELTGRNVPLLPDPVMLLNVEEWKRFSEQGMKHQSKYIFLHFLGKPNDIALQSIKLLSDKFDVICFANPYAELKSISEVSVIGGTPYDYVSLIKDAEYIFTDSFHTTHFSIIFDKNFFIFDRDYGHNNKQSTRINTIISTYRCPNRFITDSVDQVKELLNEQTNFKDICEVEHQKIVSYLENAIPKGKKLYHLKADNECTGCMACMNICPKGAIEETFSKLGYRIPIIDNSKCINCKMCEKVCNNQFELRKTYCAYIAYNKERNMMLKSASGGVFSALAKSFIEEGGVIVASKMMFVDGNASVSHVLIDEISELDSVLGSKYVESNCSNIYMQIAEMMKANRKVLFCGTSCQVKALYSFLDLRKIRRDNLFTIDLICHGVPGIKFFSDYIDYVSKKNNGKFKNLTFRIKNNGDIRYQISGEFLVNNKQTIMKIPISQSSYYDMFIRQENYREHCYHCEYATIDKPADITIGDYFEAKRDYPLLFAENGILHDSEYINCVLVRSDNGRKLLDIYGKNLFMNSVDIRRVQLSHPNLCKPSNYSHVRLDVKKAYVKKGFDGIETVYSRIFLFRKFQVKATGAVKKIINRGS